MISIKVLLDSSLLTLWTSLVSSALETGSGSFFKIVESDFDANSDGFLCFGDDSSAPKTC